MIKFQGKAVDKIDANFIIVVSSSLNTTPSRAIDILIASNHFKRIGYLDSQFIEPAVGYLNKNIQGGSLGLPGEVYHKDDVVIIQMRSNIRMGRKKQFVDQLANNLKKVVGKTDVLVAGSLPFSLRPDLQIQSVSKNVYYYSKAQNPQFKKAQENNLMKSIKLLIDQDQQATDLLGEAGFIKNIIKSDKFAKVDYLFVFSETLVDHSAASKLAKSISLASGKKQLGIVQQNILNE